MILPLVWSYHLPPFPVIPRSLQFFGFSGIPFVWSFNSEECCLWRRSGWWGGLLDLGGDSRMYGVERLVKGDREGAQALELTSRESRK